jgi:hypothetical protein
MHARMALPTSVVAPSVRRSPNKGAVTFGGACRFEISFMRFAMPGKAEAPLAAATIRGRVDFMMKQNE